MGKASISIGIDDATGQPPSAPEGPYITDRDDGSRKRHPAPRRERPASTEHPPSAPRRDLAGQRKGAVQP